MPTTIDQVKGMDLSIGDPFEVKWSFEGRVSNKKVYYLCASTRSFKDLSLFGQETYKEAIENNAGREFKIPCEKYSISKLTRK